MVLDMLDLTFSPRGGLWQGARRHTHCFCFRSCDVKEWCIEQGRILLEEITAARVEGSFSGRVRMPESTCAETILWNFGPTIASPAYHAPEVFQRSYVPRQTTCHTHDRNGLRCLSGRLAGGKLFFMMAICSSIPCDESLRM